MKQVWKKILVWVIIAVVLTLAGSKLFWK